MKTIVVRGFLIVTLCMQASFAEAQIDSARPVPDDDPVVEQSAEQLLSHV